jgi:hypothetical protein
MHGSSPPDWSERFMASLVPSDRFMVLMLLGMVFGGGVLAGVTWTTSREVDRHAREAERLSAQMPNRPTVHQRLDALEQRMQALEHRQTPSP